MAPVFTEEEMKIIMEIESVLDHPTLDLRNYQWIKRILDALRRRWKRLRDNTPF